MEFSVSVSVSLIFAEGLRGDAGGDKVDLVCHHDLLGMSLLTGGNDAMPRRRLLSSLRRAKSAKPLQVSAFADCAASELKLA